MKTKPRAPLRPPASLAAARDAIVRCERCARLRQYCAAVGQARRAAYRDWTYWARPVPGFGDPEARILVLGLAPAAHGANRTGRVFTGDGDGGSGDFLMGALHRAGFANIGTSRQPDDGLVLRGVYIAAAVRCAPPQNKPTAGEVSACLDHLAAELACLPRIDTVVALGKIAWDAWLQLLATRAPLPRPRPAFGHGVTVEWPATPGASGPLATGVRHRLIGCYHPSRQNTNTGTVTAAMYDALFGALAARR